MTMKLSCYFSISLTHTISISLTVFFPRSHTLLYMRALNMLFINVSFILNMVQQVKSRTKPFAYGMYWKQNRKQCIAFLALDSQLSMEAHMKWVELQIQNLETYRRGKD